MIYKFVISDNEKTNFVLDESIKHQVQNGYKNKQAQHNSRILHNTFIKKYLYHRELDCKDVLDNNIFSELEKRQIHYQCIIQYYVKTTITTFYFNNLSNAFLFDVILPKKIIYNDNLYKTYKNIIDRYYRIEIHEYEYEQYASLPNQYYDCFIIKNVFQKNSYDTTQRGDIGCFFKTKEDLIHFTMGRGSDVH
jgi:hypothetical protein